MGRAYENFKNWRKRSKARLVAAFGGTCGVCGYSRCQESLVFHHLDPKEKEFAVTGKKAAGWLSIVAEARKCVLLCANCHGEIHAGVVSIPADCRRFDESFATYEGLLASRKQPRSNCLHCGREVSQKPGQPYCSQSCASKAHRHTIAPTMTAEEITTLLAAHGYRWAPAAKSIGITDNALRKRAASQGMATKGLGRGPVRV